MPKILASHVSRYLSNRGHSSHGPFHHGFRASTGVQDNTVTVEYVLGASGADLSTEERRKIVSGHIYAMEFDLARRYIVARFEPAEGWHPYWLRVSPRPEKPENTLTPAMRRALRLIREGDVTYDYAPIKESLDRPELVTEADLTPSFSHRIWSVTVTALEARGLARLEPITLQHGKVVAIEGDPE